MAEKPPLRPCAAVKQTAENGKSREAGTTLANYSDTPSCSLGCSLAQPDDGQPNTWGGARNRADRVSYGLSDRQVAALIESARYAFATGRIFQRHWTVHYGLAGIQPSDGARFVGSLIDKLSKQSKRDGGRLAAIWVRECASDKGEHVHILLHLPAGMSLRNRTRRWIEQAGGTCQAGVSKVTRIGGRIAKVEISSNLSAQQNAANVVRYMLKAAGDEMGRELRLPRTGEGGRIIGKRCGTTQNISA